MANTNNVLAKKKSFKIVAAYLERMVPILKELGRRRMGEGLNSAIEIFSGDVKAAL